MMVVARLPDVSPEAVVARRSRVACRGRSIRKTNAEPVGQSQRKTTLFPNFRDVANIAPETAQSGLLFRAACPVTATDDQMQQLFRMGVTTLIDLRAPEEVDRYGEPNILKEATIWTYPRNNAGVFSPPSVSPVQEDDDARSGNGVGDASSPPTDSPEGPLFEVHRLSLLDRKRYVKRLMLQIPPLDAVMSVVYQIWDMDASEAVLMRNINSGGVSMLYEIMLRTSTVEIGAVMQVILAALERGEGAMFYCKAGKDRTGIVTALLLSLAGAPDDVIISDYVLSDPHGDMAVGSVVQVDDLRKLDREVFSRAPAEAMAKTLAFVRSEYGSTERYLIACGVQQSEQERLKRLLRPTQA